ncbi:type II secretion system protein GspN [Desulfocastanea catecholica]
MVHSVFSLRSLMYVAYAVMLTALLLYVRFPGEKFKDYCEKRIERLLPGSACTIEEIAYRFPSSAALAKIHITRTIDGQDNDMIVERLSITPEPLQFWRAYTLHGEMYSGSFTASLDVDSRRQQFHLRDIHVEGLEVEKLAESIGLADRKISGIFAFKGNYQAASNQPSDGVGTGDVEVVSGSIGLLQPILALSTIEFEKLIVGVSRQNGVIQFIDGELLGKEISADFAGEMRLTSPLLQSSILLNGHLAPDEVFLRNHPREQQFVQRLLQRYKVTVLPFKVGGTVQSPLFRFST